MATTSWSTLIRHDTDLAFQTWRNELTTKLADMVTAGVLAADETNLPNGTTSNARAGANAEQGYAVYHLADSLHGTAPIYIRFGFGTGSNVNGPRIQITTGTSTNGSGVLGGTALATIASIGLYNAAATSTTACPSYLCVAAGFFGLAHKLSNPTAALTGFFMINRTCDSTGAPTVTGSLAAWGAGGVSVLTKTQAFRYASTAIAYTANSGIANTALGLNPQSPTSTTVSGNQQVMLGWTITPQVAPLFGVAGCLDGEVTVGATFSVALVGSSAKTYVGLDNNCGPFSCIPTTSTGGIKFAMLWQ